MPGEGSLDVAKVTRIKASDTPRKKSEEGEPAIVRKKVAVADKKSVKNKSKALKKAEKVLIKNRKRSRLFWCDRWFTCGGIYVIRGKN